MDLTPVVGNARDEAAAKHRFESFKLGKGLPSNITQKHSHARSHSRNASISSSVSSLSFSVSSKSMNSADMSSLSIPTHTNSNPAPPSKRNSHHRRRSSVSTRHESAEMMGVSIPDLPPSTSEDNINLGEKDSIRRRALWALEGKPDVPFSKVEIPELSTPVMEKMMFDFSSKQSLPQSTASAYGAGLTLLSNKRDSFKLLANSSSSKDQLHTLMEEEEEEDEESSKPRESLTLQEPAAPPTPVTPSLAITKATPVKHRPATLSLRPLSLTPETLVNSTSGLPTPSPTPSPRIGLKSLALAPSSTYCDDSTNPMNAMTTRSSISPSPASRRLSLNIGACDSPPSLPSEDEKPTRRSSISYKSTSSSSSSSHGMTTNFAGLPTPEMTPTSFERRYSISDSIRSRRSSTSSGDEDFFPNHPTQTRPLSASEQHFLFKSHNALLARITDLEKALSMRRSSGGSSTNGGSRPVSTASDLSSSSDYSRSGEPNDEMLRLIADLKGERDELKRDVDGWRTRVGDMEKQLGIVAKRVEAERRDAWVARSMVGLLQVEKGTLEKKLDEVERIMSSLEDEKKALKGENEEAKQRITLLETELEAARQELEAERQANERAVIMDTTATPTPRTPEPRSRTVAYSMKKGRGFTSLDSESSTTDVDDSFEEGDHKFRFSLNSVAEEPDDEDQELSGEENGLAGYEDEEDSDVSFHSSSSFGSGDELPRSVKHLQMDFPASVTPGSDTPTLGSRPTSPASDSTSASRPTHASRASLSKTWTFPVGAQAPSARAEQDNDVDRFFGCLTDLDGESSADSTLASPSAYSFENSKSLFASGFKYGAEDDYSPFFFPGGVGVEILDTQGLDVVVEEDEDVDETEAQVDEDMFGDVGGIRITFTPPESEESFEFSRSSSPVKRPIPAINFFEYEEPEGAVPFNFGRPAVPSQGPSKAAAAPPQSVMITPPSSIPRPTPRASSPSSIPRAMASSKLPSLVSTPPKPPFTRITTVPTTNSFVTPPNKRGGTMPSFIPQAVSSPSPMRNSPAFSKQKAGATFIRQPQRKPLMLANNATAENQNVSSGPAHVNSAMNARPLRRSCNIHAARSGTRATSEMKSVDLSDHYIPPHNTTTASTPKPQYPVLQDRRVSINSSSEATGSSSSFSSIISSPLSARLSFQSLTNFIPASWAPRTAPVSESVAAPYVVPFGPSSSTVNSGSVGSNGGATPLPLQSTVQGLVTPRKRGYVSKEKQLEKLRNRLDLEGKMRTKTSVNICCDKCDGEEVFI